MVQQKDVCSYSPARTQKLQLAAEQLLIGECWVSPKKIPRVQGQRRSPSKKVYLAPFVHKRREETEAELDEMKAQFDSPEARHDYVYKKVYKYVKQQMQNFIFGLNVPSRW